METCTLCAANVETCTLCAANMETCTLCTANMETCTLCADCYTNLVNDILFLALLSVKCQSSGECYVEVFCKERGGGGAGNCNYCSVSWHRMHAGSGCGTPPKRWKVKYQGLETGNFFLVAVWINEKLGKVTPALNTFPRKLISKYALMVSYLFFVLCFMFIYVVMPIITFYQKMLSVIICVYGKWPNNSSQ